MTPDNRQLLIYGPCAAENRPQVLATATIAGELASTFKRVIARASLFKPRTEPGWAGVGIVGAPWLGEISHHIPVATEVLTSTQALLTVGIILLTNPKADITLWAGARNYNHYFFQFLGTLGRIIPNVNIMLKSPISGDPKAWIGGARHILSSGIPPKKVTLCYRGYIPYGHSNPRKLRNLTNHEDALSVKAATGLRTIFDAAHPAGDLILVPEVMAEAAQYGYDGLHLEAHPNPTEARTDAKQQVPLCQLSHYIHAHWTQSQIAYA